MTSTLVILVAAAGAANASPGVLLDFTASWCGPCQQMKPVVSRLARQGYPIRKVDVDQHPELSRKYRVNSIPAFVLVINGKEVTRIVGYASERRLKQLMSRIPKATKEVSQAAPKSSAARALPIAKTSTDSAPVRLVKDVSSRFRLPFLPKKKQSRERTIDQPATRLKNAIVRAKLDQNEPSTERVVRDVPMAASARIRVKDNNGVNYGSGTVIISRTGRTIILTCGHIFRGLSDASTIEVDIFNAGKATTYVGTAMQYNLQADVGLIAIPTRAPIPVAPLASLDNTADRGDRVFSIGCGGGDTPSKLQIRVTELNRYRGPDNIECTGVPEQGRSGGGLFSAKGEVIGVCFAADPRDRRGLYAGLQPIYKLLQETKLSNLIVAGRNKKTEWATESAPAAGRSNEARESSQPVVDRARLRALQVAAGLNASSAGESEFLNRLRSQDNTGRLKTVADVFKKSSEAEVICVIRPLSDPQAASRVVIINRASGKFVEYLNDELRDQPVTTSKTMKYATTAATPARRESRSRIGGGNLTRRTQPAEPGRYRRSRASR